MVLFFFNIVFVFYLSMSFISESSKKVMIFTS